MNSASPEPVPSEFQPVLYSCRACSRLLTQYKARCPSCYAFNTVDKALAHVIELHERGKLMAEKLREQLDAERRQQGARSVYENSPPLGSDQQGTEGGDAFQFGTPETQTRPTFERPGVEVDEDSEICEECGAENERIAKFCKECGESFGPNSDREQDDEDEEEDRYPQRNIAPGKTVSLGSIDATDVERISTGCPVFDHVLSGGLPIHICLMLASQPGTGKSTLLRQIAAYLVSLGHKVMWASGEESPKKIKQGFTRIGLFKKYKKIAKKIRLFASTDPDVILATARQEGHDFLFVDSMPVMESTLCGGSAGGEPQLIYASKQFMHASHAVEAYEGNKPMTIIAIMHGTKNSQMAGINTALHWTDGAFFMEHIDGLTLEKAKDQSKPPGFVCLRIYKKYREGDATLMGYYEMTADRGLVPYYPMGLPEEAVGKVPMKGIIAAAPKVEENAVIEAAPKKKKTTPSSPPSSPRRSARLRAGLRARRRGPKR